MDKMLSCADCQAPICISKLHLFRRLNAQQSALIISRVHRYQHHKGEVIAHVGDPLNQFAIVMSGQYKAYTVSPEGKMHILKHYKVGEFFGQEALFEAQNYRFNIEASQASSLCTLSLETVKSLIRENPDMAMNLMAEMNQRIVKLENELSHHSSDTLKERVLNLLIELSYDYASHTNQGLILKLPYSQEELAMRLGSSRESISRSLKALETESRIKMIKPKEIVIKM